MKSSENDSEEVSLRKQIRQSRFVRFFDLSLACLSKAHGDRLRTAAYSEEESAEQLDTMALRKMQGLFNWEKSIARANLDYSSDILSLVLKIEDSKPAKVCLEHCIERIFTTSLFLRDPNNVFVVPMNKFNINLGSFKDLNRDKQKRKKLDSALKRICMSSSPIELGLVRILWRRTGVLVAQWKVNKGNIDRLRADLLSGQNTTEQENGNDFVIESVLAVILHKPSPADYLKAMNAVNELNEQFNGFNAQFFHVHRIYPELSAIDRSGPVECFRLLAKFPDTQSDIAKILWMFHLISHSPTIRKFALTTFGFTTVITWAIHSLTTSSGHGHHQETHINISN
jgi:hypothetical protein